jgi:hypothetical protein
LKQELVSKRRGKLSKGILFLQDSVVSLNAAITLRKLTVFHLDLLKPLAASPDMAASDYSLFVNFKIQQREDCFRA